jgi:hypothetical protein
VTCGKNRFIARPSQRAESSGRRNQFHEGGGEGEAVQFDQLVARGPTAHEFDATADTPERLSQEPNQGLIRRGIDRGRRDLDSQLASERSADFVRGGAGLNLDRE